MSLIRHFEYCFQCEIEWRTQDDKHFGRKTCLDVQKWTESVLTLWRLTGS